MGQDRASLSPREAAQVAGVGKSTIMRAIEASQLEARRNNRNLWRIEPAALERWTANRPGPSRNNSGPGRESVPDQPADALELAAARATIAQFEARLEERAALVRVAENRAQAAELDRDRWRALAETLAARPSDPPRAPPSNPAHGPAPRRWWPWRRD